MPWKIMQGNVDCPFEVIKETGEHVACHDTEEGAKKHMAALYANEPGAQREAWGPIEHRYAGVKILDVDTADKQRLITVIAAPYEQPALVEYRSELWNELFERGAFSNVTDSPHRVRVNRDHNKSRTIGKTLRFWPDRQDGLVAEVRIAKTPLGDETLALADDDCLSASVGFGVGGGGQSLDRRTMTRRIKTAYLDHLAFVESPAYVGAKVLSVRDAVGGEAATLAPIRTPVLDQLANDDVLQWATERLRSSAEQQ